MYQNKSVSVVLATYREKHSIKKVINQFFETGLVDEIIVVNNNAEIGTDEQVKKTRAKIIYETRQGYGYAYKTGINHAKGDYIILCEPDGTYAGADIEKFLLYAKEGFDAVFGSRTGQNTPLSGADMTLGRKWANVLEAKTIEILYNTNALTEVGCTYKLYKGSVLKKLLNQSKTTNALFATELLLLTVSQDLKYIEIPISFRKRVGESSLTAKWYHLVKWGFRIQIFILGFWFNWIKRKV
jgi:glycosyltransferase involved in cell wall biosynthesis